MLDGIEAQIYYSDASAGNHLVNPSNGKRFIDDKFFGNYNTYKNLAGSELYKTFTSPPSIDKSICRYSCSCNMGNIYYRYWNGSGYENRSVTNWYGGKLKPVYDFSTHYVNACTWLQKGWVSIEGEFVYPYNEI